MPTSTVRGHAADVEDDTYYFVCSQGSYQVWTKRLNADSDESFHLRTEPPQSPVETNWVLAKMPYSKKPEAWSEATSTKANLSDIEVAALNSALRDANQAGSIDWALVPEMPNAVSAVPVPAPGADVGGNNNDNNNSTNSSIDMGVLSSLLSEMRQGNALRDDHNHELVKELLELRAAADRAKGDGNKSSNPMARTLLTGTPVCKVGDSKSNHEKFYDWFDAIEEYDIELKTLKFYLKSDKGIPTHTVNSASTYTELRENVLYFCQKGVATSMRGLMKESDEHATKNDFDDPESFISSMEGLFSDFSKQDCELPDKYKAWFALHRAGLSSAEETVVLGAIKSAGGMTWKNFQSCLTDTCGGEREEKAGQKILGFNKGSGGNKGSGSKYCHICNMDNHNTADCGFNSRTKTRAPNKGGKDEKGGKQPWWKKQGKGDDRERDTSDNKERKKKK
jgi:hypothetical protein